MTPDELKQRRKAMKLTQAEFASQLGIHRETVGSMERGALAISERTAATVRSLRLAKAYTGPKLQDPLEQMVMEALVDAGIEFRTDQGGGTATRLDFYLPAFDLSLEVKRFYSSRTAEQMARAPNVIVAQGEPAVRFLAAAIRSGDFFGLPEPISIPKAVKDGQRRAAEAQARHTGKLVRNPKVPR